MPDLEFSNGVHAFAVAARVFHWADFARTEHQPEQQAGSSQHLDVLMAFLASTRQKIESRLYHLGFSSAIVRHLLCTQMLICGVAFFIGLCLFWLTLWPLIFAAGAAIATYSLWHIARFAQANIHYQFSPKLGLKLFFGFSGRFLLIGIVLSLLIVWLKVAVVPLLIGLTSTVAGIAAWGLSRYSRKTAKEA